MAKIVELIQDNKLDELKTVVEDKVAVKVAKKIQDKKAEFVEKMRAAREANEKK
jgi:glutamine synthetase type III